MDEHTPTCFANHMGVWAMEPTWLQEALAHIKGGTWHVHVQAGRDPEITAAAGTSAGAPLYGLTPEGVAIIPIVGPMMKGQSKYGGTSTIFSRRAIRAANDDGKVREILLHIDSPGGHVAGTQELAEAVRDSSKPVTAHGDDLMASAAYWVASQAGRVTANEGAEVGSIGTMAVLEDSSKAAEAAGVEVHVITTGEYKAVGAPGVAVTDDHLADVRRRVESMNGRFQVAVTAGRGLAGESLAAVSDGRVWAATDAARMGLVDAVQPFSVTLGEVAARASAAAENEARGRRLRSEAKRAELRAMNRDIP